MTITLDPVQLLIGLAAAGVAIGLLVRWMHKLDALIHAASAVIHRELGTTRGDSVAGVVHRELQPNSGESIKDDVTALAVGLGYLGRGYDELSERVDALEHPQKPETL